MKSFSVVSVQIWNQSLRLFAIQFIFTTKLSDHHRFLGVDAKRKHDAHRDEKRRTGNKVVNQRELSETKEKETRVHRMANQSVNASRYQRVIQSNFKRR